MELNFKISKLFVNTRKEAKKIIDEVFPDGFKDM